MTPSRVVAAAPAKECCEASWKRDEGRSEGKILARRTSTARTEVADPYLCEAAALRRAARADVAEIRRE